MHITLIKLKHGSCARNHKEEVTAIAENLVMGSRNFLRLAKRMN